MNYAPINLPNEWYYRGEGNANMVLYIPSMRQILRIRKTDRVKNKFEAIIYWFISLLGFDCHSKMEETSLKFYNNLMVPLFGSFTLPGLGVQVSRKNIIKIEESLVDVRPENRKHKRLQHGKSALFYDYAFLPKEREELCEKDVIFAIEIKPKQGWIAVPSKTGKCQFCSNQLLKLKKGQINQISDYCPMDLFSGNETRMKKALKALITYPQNNFKIFKNGQIVYDEHHHIETFYEVLYEIFTDRDSIERSEENFYLLLMKILLKKFDSQSNPCKNHLKSISINNGCKFDSTKLPSGSVLEKIFSIQALDLYGSEYYYSLYRSLSKKRDWGYIDKMFKFIDKKPQNCLNCSILNCAKNQDKELALTPYLIASVANDCSFMLTFQKLLHLNGLDDNSIVSVGNLDFLVNIGVFDLYPKSAKIIIKHHKRNEKIDQIFKSM